MEKMADTEVITVQQLQSVLLQEEEEEVGRPYQRSCSTRAGTMKPAYKLRAHAGPVLCCAASPSSPHEIASSSEDATVAVFDLRSRDCAMRLQCFGEEPAASVCVNPENTFELYVAAGTTVYCTDLRMGSSGREQQKYSFNTDEINQVAVNKKGTFVCSADDSGEIKVIDIRNRKLHRTLRGVHTNICSAVQFQGRRPWEVISGGLDSKIVKWDFSKGKDLRSIDLAADSALDGGQLFNPPFVHAIAIPQGDCPGEAGKLAAIARGDGMLAIYDTGFETDRPLESKGSKKTKGRRQGCVSQIPACPGEANQAMVRVDGLRCNLNRECGGHSTAVSAVTFASFGERGQYIVSGGNDKFVKLWNWRYSKEEDPLKEGRALVCDIHHGKKVNWLSTSNVCASSIVVADTTKLLSVYHIL